MALGWAVLVLLVLSSLQVCRAEHPPGHPQGLQWVWGAAGQARAEPPLLSRSRRDDGGQQPSTPTVGHDPPTTAVPKKIKPDLLLGSVPPPGTNASLHQAPTVITTADPLDETDSPEPDLMLSSAPAPSTNASLHWARVVPSTADPLDETDSPEPDLMLSSAPAPSTHTSLHQALMVPTTADPQDETDSPEPDLMLSSAPAPSNHTSLHQALMVPTTADPQDETDSPEPDLMLSSAPEPSNHTSLHWALMVPTTADPQDETSSPDPDLLMGSVPPAEPTTRAAPQKSVTTVPSWLTPPGKDETMAGSTDNSSSVTPSALVSTTGSKKARAPPAPTHSAPSDTEPRGTVVPVPWEPSRVVGKCLLAILLLGLVAATFLLSTGVLGALLWRRARTAQRRLSHTEMVCISSLLPDGEAAANGPRPGPARRPKLLLDGSSEADGDNLTLSSFLPEHA